MNSSLVICVFCELMNYYETDSAVTFQYTHARAAWPCLTVRARSAAVRRSVVRMRQVSMGGLIIVWAWFLGEECSFVLYLLGPIRRVSCLS